jgi:hypothetical protein
VLLAALFAQGIIMNQQQQNLLYDDAKHYLFDRACGSLL